MNRTITLVLIGFCSVVYAGPWEAIDGLQIGKISAQRLSGESTVLRPAASPDGKYIAYVDHWTSIWIADANGENAKKIVNVIQDIMEMNKKFRVKIKYGNDYHDMKDLRK